MSESRDRAEAAAIEVAYQYLIKQGWRFTAEDVGKRAREIIDSLDSPRKSTKTKPRGLENGDE